MVLSASPRSHVSQLDATLAALADPNRRLVVDLLRREPRRAGDLADELGVSRPAMSRHLKVLRCTGLIEPASDDADARARIYRLLPEPFGALRRWLDDVEQFWRHELDAFRRHAEALHGSPAAPPPSDDAGDRARPGDDATAPSRRGSARSGPRTKRRAVSARRTGSPGGSVDPREGAARVGPRVRRTGPR